MSHSVHPYAHRLGVLRDWRSRWFARPVIYKEFLRADILIREYLVRRLRGKYVSTIDIERSPELFRIIIRTSRPGMVIGRNGEGSIQLKKDIVKQVARHRLVPTKELKIDIEEVKNPDAEAAVVAYAIAEALEKRMPFRRILKQAMEKIMAAPGVQGVKITLSGRLGGADMGRIEKMKRGRVPLQMIRADVDFAREKAYLSYGVIGIKVWICRGDTIDRPENAQKP
jgi:small subunit ribosomal protein S3